VDYRPRLACLGDLMLDVVVQAEAAPEPGTDVRGSIRFRVGGSAANTARAFATLGGYASLICVVGQDALSGRLVASARADGVVVHAVRAPGRTPRLLALVGEHGERSFVTDRSIADQLPPERLRPAWLTRLDGLHIPAYSLLDGSLPQAARVAARSVHERGGTVSVDLASYRPLLAHGRAAAVDAVRAVEPDIVLANAAEAAALSGVRRRRGSTALDEQMLELAPLAVVKQGASGCRIVWRARAGEAALAIDVATRSITASDTTGAGDAFDAGFLHSLLANGHRRGVPVAGAALRRAALAGHHAAARVLTRPRTELVL
jgi:ribokinase